MEEWAAMSLKTNEMEAPPQIVEIICDAVNPGTDLLVEGPTLYTTWNFLL